MYGQFLKAEMEFTEKEYIFYIEIYKETKVLQ